MTVHCVPALSLLVADTSLPDRTEDVATSEATRSPVTYGRQLPRPSTAESRFTLHSLRRPDTTDGTSEDTNQPGQGGLARALFILGVL